MYSDNYICYLRLQYSLSLPALVYTVLCRVVLYYMRPVLRRARLSFGEFEVRLIVYGLYIYISNILVLVSVDFPP